MGKRKTDEQTLDAIRVAWSRVAGFATCVSDYHQSTTTGPSRRYRIEISYPELQNAQDAYRALGEITVLLKPKRKAVKRA